MRCGGDHPRVADEALLNALGLPALHGDEGVRVAAHLNLVAFPGRSESPCWIEIFLAHQPVDRDPHHDGVGDDGVPAESSPGNLTGGDHADRRLNRRGGHRDLLAGPDDGFGGESESVDDQPDRLEEAAVEQFLHRPANGALGCAAETHHMAEHVRCAVGPQVGEFLGADVGDPGGHHRQQQRKQFGGRTRPDTGAVQGCVALPRRRLQWGRLGLAGIEPAERTDHILARSQQRAHLVGIGQQRGVDDGVGIHREDLVDTVGGGHPELADTDDLPNVFAHLGFRVHPAADQLELGML